jgi:hypothetical protein
MHLTDEMIKNCLQNINEVYDYGFCEENLYQNHWVRIWFSKALQDLYGYNLPVPTVEQIKSWKLQTLRKQKLIRLNERDS